METVLEVLDAVKGLSPAERIELFARLRDSGIGAGEESRGADFARYESEEFTRELTEYFHRAKRRALYASE